MGIIAPKTCSKDPAHQHVRVKTDAEREQAPDIPDDLNGKHEDGDGHQRAAEMLEITYHPVLADTLVVVIEERRHRTAERRLNQARGADFNLQCRIRHGKSWDKTQQVADATKTNSVPSMAV